MNSRFIVVTGKGGVGKTLVSLALTYQKKNLIYCTFTNNSIESEKKDFNSQGASIAKELGIPFLLLDLEECSKEYLALRFHSQLVAGVIVRTSFFRAMVNMIPSVSYLIFLGKILYYLEKNPQMTLVLDAPSSGHVLTLFESIKNFQEIFMSGLIFDDILRMIKILNGRDFLRILIVTLPSAMAIAESIELKGQLQTLMADHSPLMICNNCLPLGPDFGDSLPPFLKQKIELERKSMDSFSSLYPAQFLPHFLEIHPSALVPLIDEKLKLSI